MGLLWGCTGIRCMPIQCPRSGQHLLDPQQTGDGLSIRHSTFAAPGGELLRGCREDVKKFACVQPALAQGQSAANQISMNSVE
jgi:hypothetical protein